MISYSASDIFKEALDGKKTYFFLHIFKKLTVFSQIVSHARHANANEVLQSSFYVGDVCITRTVMVLLRTNLILYHI